MNKTYITVLAVALLAAPLAYAHDPAGTPKNYCETQSEWNVHDYGPVASGSLLYGFIDGNIGGDCDGSGLGLELPYACGAIYLDRPLDSDPHLCGQLRIDQPFADRDGHSEFAFGGAWLLVESGNGWSNPNGAGTLYCFGEEGHHPVFPLVYVEDVTLGAGASVLVGVDTGIGDGPLNIPPYDPSDDCGDWLIDEYVECVSSCYVDFPPGLDGAYHVFVTGTQGHLSTW